MKKISFRTWASIVTFGLIAVLLFVSRHELVHSWRLMGQVDMRIIWLVLPLVVVSYLSAGEIMFSYLRQKKAITNINILSQMRMSLELNFVNHVLPSGGVSGLSYMNWRLGKYGVSSGRATMAQMVRYATSFGALVCLLAVSVVIVTIDGTINRWIILMSSLLVTVMIMVILGGVYLLRSEARIRRLAAHLTRLVNGTVRRLTAGRRRVVLRQGCIEDFLIDMHDDFMELRSNRRLLIRPFWWSMLFTVIEIAVFWTVFWSLGLMVNPAAIMIGYGLATVMGIVFVTPGGAGAYETVMVMILAFAGTAQGEAIAGVVLARAIILAVIVVVGYVVYQHALLKYGKKKDEA